MAQAHIPDPDEPTVCVKQLEAECSDTTRKVNSKARNSSRSWLPRTGIAPQKNGRRPKASLPVDVDAVVIMASQTVKRARYLNLPRQRHKWLQHDQL